MTVWDSNGDISPGRIQVDAWPDDMAVSGKIDTQSFVVLVSATGSITVDGKIDGGSYVVLESTTGSITITGKIDGGSNVTLKAAGDVHIGTAGSDDDKKIDGTSHVRVTAGGNIRLGSFLNNSTVDFSAHGTITLGPIDWGAYVRQIADGDITVLGKIDGNQFDHGPSHVELVSNRGSVTVNGKVDGKSNVYVTAAGNIALGADGALGSDDRKIAGDSFVTAVAQGGISAGSDIRDGHTTVDLAANGTVSVGGTIAGGATVRLMSASGPGNISVGGGIADSNTRVLSWPDAPTPHQVGGGAHLDVPADSWAPAEPLMPSKNRDGYWWQNWGQTFGYLAPFRIVPRSLGDLVAAVVGTGPPSTVGRVDTTPVKAVGGGWSFTDAALPFTAATEVDQASLLGRGRWQRQDVRNLLEGITDDTAVQPMDLLPQASARDVSFSTMYDQNALRQVTASGAQLPASPQVRLIDMRSLASSLSCELKEIRAVTRHRPNEILFHVEAGITMADLQQLLDHQHPRLALLASGGSPGATLAGALSTATHGGEFRWPLLVDCVRAVHLVGPGGEQWWIEGDVPVADQAKLQARYPAIDPAHFIDSSWSAIAGLSGQDVLDAVVVSMGSMGVVYSVVLQVFPQFGIRQVVHPTTWSKLLEVAQTSEAKLRAGDPAANQAVLDTLINGVANGTGIAGTDNVYVDLAINPLNLDCWIVNRERTTPELPIDANGPAPGPGDFMNALSMALARHADSVSVMNRLMTFLSYGSSIFDLPNDIAQISRLAAFVTGMPDVLSAAAAAGNAQAVLNEINNSGAPASGQQFLADVLTGFFHALEGTAAGGRNSDHTGVSYKVGAIGWPDTGLPGRGLEIALPETTAFTFLQTVLIDDVLTMVAASNKPFLGYISVRVCPPTRTLLGMQQYTRHSVMIEVVAYRSPQANDVLDQIEQRAIGWTGPGPKPLLHWGLENDRVDHAFLVTTPLGDPYKGGLTRLEAFKQVRAFLRKNHPPVFDNTFTSRIGV
jgi:hypothetical protein